MQKHIEITNPIYPFIFHIFLNYTNPSKVKSKINLECKTTQDKIYKKIDKIIKKKDKGRCFEKDGWIIVIIQDFKNTPDCFDTLHHEITHAVDFSAHYIGLKQHKVIREYSAYLHGYITNQIYQKIL